MEFPASGGGERDRPGERDGADDGGAGMTGKQR